MEFPHKLYFLDEFEFTPIDLFMEWHQLHRYTDEIKHYLPQRDVCHDMETAIDKFIEERQTAELIKVDGLTAYYQLSSGGYCALQELRQYYSWHPDTGCNIYGSLESAIEAVEEGD